MIFYPNLKPYFSYTAYTRTQGGSYGTNTEDRLGIERNEGKKIAYGKEHQGALNKNERERGGVLLGDRGGWKGCGARGAPFARRGHTL